MVSLRNTALAFGLFQGLTACQDTVATVTPSPGAAPVYVTSQGQTVTTYVPEYTLCPIQSNADFANCSTGYGAKATAVCSSTIDVPGGLPLIVSDCTAPLTFSTQSGCGANTYYAASWQDVVTGIPNNTVTAAVCSGNSSCSTYLERWVSTYLDGFPVSTTTADYTATITGPGVATILPSSTITLNDSNPTTITVSTVYTVQGSVALPTILTQTLTGNDTGAASGSDSGSDSDSGSVDGSSANNATDPGASIQANNSTGSAGGSGSGSGSGIQGNGTSPSGVAPSSDEAPPGATPRR